MNLDDALHTFIVEGNELLEQMEEALLQIEQTPDDPDAIGAIFRAAHTIKGSAGLFGLDHVVQFTHVAESVLDKVRSSEIVITSELVALFLAVRDHLGRLLELIAQGQDPDDETQRNGTALADRLRAYLGESPIVPRQGSEVVEHTARVEQESEGGGVHTDNWHLSLRFGKEVLQNGLDPLAFIRYLTTFGRIDHIVTLVDLVPPLQDLDPESSWLGYEISFHSDADKATIESAFEFVREDAQIHILPPHSKIAEYIRLIEEMPDEELRLGEILVRCGTLTQSELDDALRQQVSTAEQSPPPIGEVLVKQNLVQPSVVEAALDKQKQVKEHKSAEGSLIRVNAEKLDEHINLIGELIIASAGASLIAQRANIPELFEAAARLSRLVEEVRDSALTLRMVQIGATFTKFQRVVRDVSAELKKDIRLVISGAETELDKTVVEKIGDPLTHLVRNSMDHGIEPVEMRLARGKPAHGTIRLNAYHDSGSIVIEVSDDGGGLNKERILGKAIERGLVKPDQPLSDGEIHNLIFEAGFSTAEQVNNLSGRGVGMDVVRRNIMALRGSVEIESTVGVGTSSFVVPLDMVVECVELSAADRQLAQGHDHLNLRGEVLPFIRLKQLFEIDELTGAGEPQSEISRCPGVMASGPDQGSGLQPVRRENVVVVQYAGHRAGLVVEELMGEFQTVIRPLGLVFNGLQGISGFTILGNGHVALILDVPGLVRRVAVRDQRRHTGRFLSVVE